MTGNKIIYVEYFWLPGKVDLSCDWEDEFGVHNYFIDGIGFSSYETNEGTILQIFDNASKSYKVFSNNLLEFANFISERLNSNKLVPSELRNADFINGLSETSISGDNDVESVYEYLGDIDVDFEYDTDNVSDSYANHFGCRVWELNVLFEMDIDDDRVVLSNIAYNGEIYNDINDAFQDAEYEEDVKKTIAIVSKEYK